MPNEEWGVKRLCPTTGKRFYDLNQVPIVSPYTGEKVEIENGKSRMIAADSEDAVTAKAKEAKASEEEEDILKDDDEDGNVDLGDDVLDDDDEEGDVSLDEIADVAADEDES